MEHLRSTHSWTYQTCLCAHNSGTTQQSDGSPQKPRNTLKKLTVMQWNCDYLATKIPELRVVIKKYAVDIILLQETKLDLEDPTLLLEGFDAIRTDGKGSGTHTRRGGGLITYIKKGLQYSVPQCPAVSPLEQQCILLPTSSRRSSSITNVYIPPESLTHTRDFSSLPSAQGLICGDFNAHHPVWDDVARSDDRGTALFQWVEDNSKLVLNDGTPTRASRNNQGPGFSSSDITLVDADAANSFDWSVLNELNSDHFPVLINII